MKVFFKHFHSLTRLILTMFSISFEDEAIGKKFSDDYTCLKEEFKV